MRRPEVRLRLVAPLALFLVVGLASAHEEDELALGGVYPDPGLGNGQFTSHRAGLDGWVGIDQFTGTLPTQGNDIWGYSSPAGREYALVGLDTCVGVVDVTDPVSPAIVAELVHPTSDWSDTRTFGEYGYTSNQASGGIQVWDLSQVDGGVVTELAPVTDLGLSYAHTIALDPVSGYLYTAGSNIVNGGIVAIDLANPAAPVVVGTWAGNYVHALQVVTHETGPYAGLEIAYASGGNSGFEILDVTDKANITLLSTLVYPTKGYTHQGWLDWDHQLFYLDDEGDERQGLVGTTTTYVFDVADLANPTLVSTFSTGLVSIDHNLMGRDGLVFEADYTTGLRIFDARVDPIAPVEVGWLDTYPSADGIAFNGAWGVYAGLPSGTVLVSDIQGGLFVVDPTDAETLPPDAFAPTAPADGAFVLPGMDVLAWEAPYAATSVTLEVSPDAGFATIAASADLAPGTQSEPVADLALGTCGTWYWRVTAHNWNGDTASAVRSFSIGPPGDLVPDGTVDGADAKRFKKAFAAGHPLADLDGSGAVDGADRGVFLANFGRICP